MEKEGTWGYTIRVGTQRVYIRACMMNGEDENNTSHQKFRSFVWCLDSVVNYNIGPLSVAIVGTN